MSKQQAQTEPTDSAESTPTPSGFSEELREQIAKAVGGLKLRGIGPAVMGGRVADIAVNPLKRSTWYVAAGSGGLWKTSNAGTTWQPVFDAQPSYSIGCVTVDPNNPDVVWVGTGENVSGRHVAWGDGVYKSLNGGQTWAQMGLKTSEHIGRILVDPRNSDTVFVAAEGPLWSSGGERGVYKTTDGGVTWTAALTIDEHTGVTDIAFDPSNPDVIYAAAYQRRRHVYSFLAGGPGSGVYKSADGGNTWRKLTEGLPKGDMGKIGLAITPADPSLVYATIEADEKERGFYRSTNRGESWEKRNSYISGGTGPHYYQEIEASPTDPDCVYQMDVFIQVTKDGGKTFSNLEDAKGKHSDNHALWIDPDDGAHLIAGADGGLYESFDGGVTWRHFPNLPISQFYRLGLDNSEPFYNILGGAQDLGTLFGPSRTLNVDGVRNQDWYVPTGADGYHVAFDPDDPDTFYLEFQVGNVFRYDRRREEAIDIKPQPAPGDPPERWNWDTPILISPHNRQRLYVASQRVWRSDNRGDAWTPISGDLTRNRNRYELEMVGRVWSIDDLYDNNAMSLYATVTALTESPVAAGILYTGSDDGVIQVSDDDGATWREAAALPGVPPFSFINDVEADQHDADGVFAVADAHKTGDYAPYVFESRDKGRTWRSLRGDLPDGTIVWAIQQDHENPDLLFIAAEFALYFSPNRGDNWFKLSGNVPTIAFRDLKVHRRDGDLVGASFGRGFYVLDDYAPLRTFSAETLANDGVLFPVRDAWWYIPAVPMQSAGQPTLGSSAFRAENPPFGAVFTYYLKEKAQSSRDVRRAAEKKQREAAESVAFPGWEQLRREATEREPQVWLLVRDADGQLVRWVAGSAESGLHRAAWDLRLAPPNPVQLKMPDFMPPWASPPTGPLAAPGRYSVELCLVSAEGIRSLASPQPFDVKPLPTAAAAESDGQAVAAFQQTVGALIRQIAGASKEIERTHDRLKHIDAALFLTPASDPALFARVDAVRESLTALQADLEGDQVRQERKEATAPSIRERAGRVVWTHWSTSQMPTQTQRDNFRLAETQFKELQQALATLIDDELAQLEADLAAAGAPWTPGRRLA